VISTLYNITLKYDYSNESQSRISGQFAKRLHESHQQMHITINMLSGNSFYVSKSIYPTICRSSFRSYTSEFKRTQSEFSIIPTRNKISWESFLVWWRIVEENFKRESQYTENAWRILINLSQNKSPRTPKNKNKKYVKGIFKSSKWGLPNQYETKVLVKKHANVPRVD